MDLSNSLTKLQLLAEVEDVIRSMPDKQRLHLEDEDVLTWLGRAAAIIENWDMGRRVAATFALNELRRPSAIDVSKGAVNLIVLLRQAQSDLRLKTIGPVNKAISQGDVFYYFDELRKIIALAKSDLLFVDRYMEGDFVATYLPYVGAGVTIRLLSRDKISALVPAARAFAKQFGATIEVRSAQNFHDRWVFVDKSACYQSGASFKDGARAHSTTLTQNIDAFGVLHSTYESMWQQATIHPL
jgi:hypothetical protein